MEPYRLEEKTGQAACHVTDTTEIAVYGNRVTPPAPLPVFPTHLNPNLPYARL